jgi:hypothetical protein
MEWITTNWPTLLQVVGGVIAACSAAVGLSNKPKAQNVSSVLLSIAKFFSAVTFRDEPGTLSIPLTDKDIVPKA